MIYTQKLRYIYVVTLEAKKKIKICNIKIVIQNKLQVKN